MDPMPKPKILVTGVLGYVASHLIKLLLLKDYQVRGTVRSLSNKQKYDFLYNLAPEKNCNLELVEANLTNRSSWDSAVEGCEYVFHIASPVPPYVPKDEMEIIGPAVSGTTNVLEACLAKGVKKIVVTSSCLAITIGNSDKVSTEETWSKEEECPAYPKSKVRAERAAWEFFKKNKDKIKMTVVNPSLVLGLVFIKHGNSSETLITDIMNGEYPGIMDVKLAVSDVRDVAEGHFRAMFEENTNGKRYIIAGEDVSMEKVVRLLKDEFGKYGYNIVDKHVDVQEVIESGNAVAQRQVNLIGKENKINNEKSIKELHMKYTPVEKTVVDMGYSLIERGAIPNKISQNESG